MRKCLKCGSIDIAFQKEEMLGKQSQSLRCLTCGEEWKTEQLSLQFLKFVTFYIEEFDKDGTKAGDFTLNLFPSGMVRLAVLVAGDPHIDYYDSDMFDIPAEKANKVMKELDGCIHSSGEQSEMAHSGKKLTLKMHYLDNGILTFTEESTPAISRIMDEIYQANEELKELLSISLVEEAKEREKKRNKKKEKKEYYIASKAEDALYRLTARHSDATGHFTADGFVVLAGSRMAKEETVSCLKSVREIRAQMLSDGTAVDYVLSKDVKFKTQSRACSVMSGGLGNVDYWKPQSFVLGGYYDDDESDEEERVFYEWIDALKVPGGPLVSGCPLIEKALIMTNRFRSYLEESVIMNALKQALLYEQKVIIPVIECDDPSDPDDADFQIPLIKEESGATWFPIFTNQREAAAMPETEKVVKYFDAVQYGIQDHKDVTGVVFNPFGNAPVWIPMQRFGALAKPMTPAIHVLPVDISEVSVDAVVVDASLSVAGDCMEAEADFSDIRLMDAGVMKSDCMFVCSIPDDKRDGEYRGWMIPFCKKILSLAEMNHMTSLAFADILPLGDDSADEETRRQLFKTMRRWLKDSNRHLAEIYFCVGDKKKFEEYISILDEK